MFIPITVAILFILGLFLMFTLTPGARDAVGSPSANQQPNAPTVEANGPLDTVTDPQTTDPTPSQPQETQPEPTEPTEPPIPPDTTLPGGRVLSAHHSFVYDTREDRLVYTGGDADDHVYPASITKVMTCHVMLKYMDPSTIVTVGDEITLIDPYSSRADLKRGDKLSVELLVYAMMLPSGNDAAYTAATACGREIAEDPNLDVRSAISLFIREMNEEAKLLGMKNTNFVTPDGNHDSNHYTSTRDLSILLNAVLDNSIIRSAARTPKKDVSDVFGRTQVWYNSNALIRSEKPVYTPTAVGFKTGTTSAGGSCLVALFMEDDGYLIIGVLGSTNDLNRYHDTLALYEFYK